MNVLLVEPPKRTWELMGDCVSPPLGLAQLATVLEEEKIPVNIIDCNASKLSWDALEDFIAKEKPDIVGATTITPWFYYSNNSKDEEVKCKRKKEVIQKKANIAGIT